MIDDEMLPYMDQEEDAFFGSRKRRRRRKARRRKRREMRRSRPKVIARKERQKAFKTKVANVYRDIGGATAIGQAVDSLLLPTGDNTTNTPSDFEVGLLSENVETPSENKGVPTTFFVIGGVLVLGVVGVIIYKRRQAKLSL